jgi:hypothetical protein
VQTATKAAEDAAVSADTALQSGNTAAAFEVAVTAVEDAAQLLAQVSKQAQCRKLSAQAQCTGSVYRLSCSSRLQDLNAC